jgi:hypothetical protein
VFPQLVVDPEREKKVLQDPTRMLISYKGIHSFSAGAGFHKPICCSCTLKDLLTGLSSSRMFEAPSNSSTINQSLKKLITNILVKLW